MKSVAIEFRRLSGYFQNLPLKVLNNLFFSVVKTFAISWRVILGLAVYMLFPSISSAQESMSASGGEAKGSGGSVSYSAGQLFYMTHSGADGYVSEGVTDHLMLRIDRYNFENLEFQLFDVTGRMVKNGLITGHETLIDMRGLARGTFLLRVLDKEKEIKTFRIIKF